MKPHDAKKIKVFAFIYITVLLGLVVLSLYYLQSTKNLESQLTSLFASEQQLKTNLEQTEQKLSAVQNEDQFVKNKQLEETIGSIETTYAKTVSVYEDLLEVKITTKNTSAMDTRFAKILSLLSQTNYTSASAELALLQSDISKAQAETVSSFTIPENVAANNTAPRSGYQRQRVDNEFGSFLVDVVAADLNSTRVIIDTASSGDCRDNCPVLPLADYVSRSGGFAGINGPYFCPSDYPGCAGKTNTFDTLLMNKDKTYFNSDNNIYSNVPAGIFSAGSARWVTASSQWGRSTDPDSVIASQPLLVLNGSVVFGGDTEVKRGSKGTRSFIGSTGSTVYIGVVRNVTAAEMARVLHTMGIQNALNLDSGGSTAFISNGRYIAGPGRLLPFGIVLVGR